MEYEIKIYNFIIFLIFISLKNNKSFDSKRRHYGSL